MVMVQALAPILVLLLCLPLVEILAIILLHAMIGIFRSLLVAIDALEVEKNAVSVGDTWHYLDRTSIYLLCWLVRELFGRT